MIALVLVAVWQGLPLIDVVMSPPMERWGELEVATFGSGETAIVVLHGRFSHAWQVMPIAEELARSVPGRYVVPEGPVEPEVNRAWIRWSHDEAGAHVDHESVMAIRGALTDVVRRAGREGARRLVLCGISEGAQVAMDVALALDPRPDAVVLLAGNLLETWHFERAAGLRTIMAHGREDGMFPFDNAELVRDELVRAGAEVTWLPFDGGHEAGPLAPVGEALARVLAEPRP